MKQNIIYVFYCTHHGTKFASNKTTIRNEHQAKKKTFADYTKPKRQFKREKVHKLGTLTSLVFAFVIFTAFGKWMQNIIMASICDVDRACIVRERERTSFEPERK